MKGITMSLLFIITAITFSFGQTQKAITENGKKVTLNSDGTWKYTDTVISIQKTLNLNDCSYWISTETDKVDGNTTTAGKNTIIVSTDGGKTGFGIFMMQSAKGGLILSIQAAGAGNCIDEGAKINILFADGSRLLLSNNGKFNCKGNSTVYFGGFFGKNSELQELKNKRIQTMRVWTSDSFVEKDFNANNQEEFIRVINCLTK